jgi:antitoxin component HigA of HigAB toxin-antitoxin module
MITITTEQQYREAFQELNMIWDKLDQEVVDHEYFDQLVDAIEAWENIHYSLD